ncbi:MAG: redoxin domain-containing protein [Planctomycetia bacterium]|nr:redoxin domain-containing protein [Planctomycetia bacterium]
MSFLLAIIFQLSDLTVHPLAPRWKAGQEFLYQGTVTETSKSTSSQGNKEYKLELRILVTRILGNSAEIICCTRLFETGILRPEDALSIHLTHAIIDHLGHITSCNAPTGKSIRVDGPATWENGFLVPLVPPKSLFITDWESPESGRLPRRFNWSKSLQNNEADQVNAVQESIDWQRPRADTTAWKRSDSLTFSRPATLPNTVERLIIRRAPAHQDITSEIKTSYTLVSSELLQGPRFEERLADIYKIKSLQETIQQLAMHKHDKDTRTAWQLLEKQVQQLQSSPGNTPFRDALITMRSTIAAGLDNRLTIQQVNHEIAEQPFTTGSLVPHFQLLNSQGNTVRLQQFQGKPCLLVFFQPGSELTKSLSFEIPLWMNEKYKSRFQCLFISSADVSKSMLPELSQQDNTIQVVLGKSIMNTFGVSATPHFILLDADGAFISCFTGWGNETRHSLDKIIRKELAKLK